MGDHGHRMRCAFVLRDLRRGLAGGADGRCERNDGLTATADFG